MATQTPRSMADTIKMRAELREIMDEKSLLDDIEGDLERTRSKEDDERTKKRQQEDADVVREREVIDQRREARQKKLCERETAIRTNLKACRLLGQFSYSTLPARPSVRSLGDFEDSDLTISSSDSRRDGTHKRPRTGSAGPSTARPQPLVGNDNSTSLQGRERVSPQREIKAEENDSQASLTKSLRDMVSLQQLQTLPPANHATDLGAFAGMPHFTREFISEYIGGSNSECGLIPVGRYKKAAQIVKCDGYLVLNPFLNPYIPSAPGQHFAFLDLQSSQAFEGEPSRRKVFPVFLCTSKACWHYSGHYAESIAAAKIKEPMQKQLVSEMMLDKWVGSLFERKHELTDFGLKVLLESGLFSQPEEWKTITKEKVKLAIIIKRRTGPYTQIPFWFRFLQCVAFDRTFHDALVGKKLESADTSKRLDKDMSC